jgi:hypothetical protein
MLIGVVIFALRYKIAAAYMTSSVFVLFFVFVTFHDPWEIDVVISARWVSRIAPKEHRDFDARQAAAYRVRRPFLYQLNYYLHQELPEWDGKDTKPKWLIVSPQSVSELQKRGFQCESNLRFPALVCEQPKDLALSEQRAR